MSDHSSPIRKVVAVDHNLLTLDCGHVVRRAPMAPVDQYPVGASKRCLECRKVA